MSKNKDMVINKDGSLAYFEFANAAVITITDSKDLFKDPDRSPISYNFKNKKLKRVVPNGDNNNLPSLILNKVGKSPDMTTNMSFNISACYGDGVTPIRIKVGDDGKRTYIPVYDNEEINTFFEYNDIGKFVFELFTDLNYFNLGFAELIFNKEDDRKIVQLSHKETTFSRFEEMDENGISQHHFYANWDSQIKRATGENIIVTPLLSPNIPILDIKRRLGKIPDINGDTKDEGEFRYMMSISLPSAGRFYYPKPSYNSLFESGWYDFAMSIPSFKSAILKNQMTVKYVVYIHDNYFSNIFAEEAITTDKAKKERITAEYKNIQNFLSGEVNSGKSVISKVKYTPDGKETPFIKIVPIENAFKGGEYIEDSEEASNILAYGMNIHGSLIGSHGKSKTINGTEARELFMIKQVMLKPYRDRVLKIFDLIKAVNGWPKDIYFMIPHMQLTTLDMGTGATKQIGLPTN